MSKIIGGLKTSDVIIDSGSGEFTIPTDINGYLNKREAVLSLPTTQAWYEFKSGSELDDSSDNSYSLIEIGGPVIFTDSYRGLGNIVKTTSTSALEAPSGLAGAVSNTSFTMTTWFNRDETPDATEYPLLEVSRDNLRNLSLQIALLNGQIIIRNTGQNPNSIPLATSTTTTYNDGLWHHLVVVIDTSLIIYIDGIDKTSNFAISNPPASWLGVSGLNKYYIGNSPTIDAAYLLPLLLLPFDDDVFLLNDISGNNITGITNNGVTQGTSDPPPRDAVAVFDGSSDIVVNDSSFNNSLNLSTNYTLACWFESTQIPIGHFLQLVSISEKITLSILGSSLQLSRTVLSGFVSPEVVMTFNTFLGTDDSFNNTPITNVNGVTISGGFATFNGSNTYFSMTDSDLNTRLSGLSTMSYGCWFRSTASADRTLIRITGSSSNAMKLSLSNGQLSCFHFVGGTITLFFVTTSPPLYNDGIWHHVVFCTGTSGGNQLYVDGVQNTSLFYFTGNASTNSILPTVTGTPTFGSDVNTGDVWLGDMDGIFISSSRYSSGEVSSLFGLARTNELTFNFRGTTTSLNVNDGNWHHAIVVLGPSSNKMYVDGTLQTLSYSSGSSSTRGKLVSVPESLTIGRASEPFYVGSLDNVFVSTSAYSDSEALELFSVTNNFEAMYPNVAPYLTNYTISDGVLTSQQISDIYDGGCIDQPFNVKSDLRVDNLTVTGSIYSPRFITSSHIRINSTNQSQSQFWESLDFDTMIYQVGSDITFSGKTFTLNSGGVYMITAQLYFAPSATGSRSIRVFANGTTVYGRNESPNNGASIGVRMSTATMIYYDGVSPSSYTFTIDSGQGSGGNLDVLIGNTEPTQVAIVKIS
jgi:hypothetical protein